VQAPAPVRCAPLTRVGTKALVTRSNAPASRSAAAEGLRRKAAQGLAAPYGECRDEIGKGILDKEFGLYPDSFEFTVRSGIVTIAGLVDFQQTALNLLARIRHSVGVVGVRDRLSYPIRTCALASD